MSRPTAADAPATPCVALTRGRKGSVFNPYVGYCIACRWTVAGADDRVDEAVRNHGTSSERRHAAYLDGVFRIASSAEDDE